MEEKNSFYALSVVIPQYNGLAMLQDCMASLRRSAAHFYERQALPVELIVVDNASSDGSSAFLGTLSDMEESPLRLHCILNHENHGFAKAVNQGIRAAAAEYVVLLNNDTIVEEGFLYALFSCIRGDERIFSASAMMRMYHERELIDDAGDIYCLMGWALQRGHGKPASSYRRPCRVFSACGGASIYRRRIFEEIGFFDENFFAYMEDVDIGYRAGIYGYHNVYCPEAVVYHIGSASSGGHVSSFKVHLSSRNSIYVIYKNMPVFQLLINLPFLLLGSLIKYIHFTRDGYGKDFVRGLGEAFSSLPRIRRTPFSLSRLPHLLYLEWAMFLNTFKAFVWKLQRLRQKLRKKNGGEKDRRG